ncbi:MAG: lamin tail domain-containing protein [Kofleriaceae bacterium]|nr:lamin tail domain-containing protein [Kofleriaceae bacterium]
MKSKYLLLASAILLAPACGGEDGPIDGDTVCSANLLTGDLVITEVMANPEGEDEGNEYFEIYNATSAAIDLAGLVLEKSAVDGSKVKEHVMSTTIIEAGQYLALGGVLPEFRAPYIAYGYADALGAMTNSGGQLALRCKETEVDRLIYGEAASGRSQGLDGNISPDHLANDDISNFCDATTEFATDAFGSPGVANEPCTIIDQTTCLDNGSSRDVVNPGVGELVISEFMANPDAVPDAVGEWFEIVATASFDLNGIVAGKVADDPKLNIVDENCITVSAGDRFLFARSEDPLVNGGLPTPDYTFSFSMTNSGASATLFVGTSDTVIDQIAWTGSGTGKSTALDSLLEDAISNDDESNWCDGQTPYGDGDLGTPGTANLPCDTSGMCMDVGGLRPTVAPVIGDVTITEFMANPAAVPDSDGEWFEVHFAQAVDLNGLQLGKIFDPLTVVTTLDEVNCISVPADTYVLFARNPTPDLNAMPPESNGGLPTTNIFLYSAALTNSNSSIFIAIDDAVLDSVSYTSTGTAGDSTQINGMDTCFSTIPYGDGDNGSPGLVNEGCP